MKGGNADPTSESRRAELRMGRNTNARLNRRDEQQAYVGVLAWPKKGHGERPDTLPRDPGGIPKYPGEKCDPKRNAKQLPGTA
jgi:hypothetical protein